MLAVEEKCTLIDYLIILIRNFCINIILIKIHFLPIR
jgi:hypothetical protein